jgi:Integrase core domain
VPAQILTDNGKVFTGRFGLGSGEVLFDRICRENGIKHLLTAPGSPTTTGKVERFHKTLRREFLDGKVFADLDEAQAAIDAWVTHYDHDRPHQGIGMIAPWEGFRLADPDTVDEPEAETIGPVTTGWWAATARSPLPATAIGSVCGSPARPSRSPSTLVW